MRDAINRAVISSLLLLAGCVDRSLPGDPPEPALRLSVGWASYAPDGTLIVASRERVIRLDAALNEIDRTVPPFPFDPKVTPPGLQFFSASRDGRVAAMSWQSDSHKEPVRLPSGSIVFEVPSAKLLRSDTYAGIDVQFQGLAVSPDGLSMATADIAGNVQVADVVGGLRWQGQSTWVHPPVFTADSSMLILAPTETRLEVRRTFDGFTMSNIGTASPVTGLVGVSNDGLTFAAHVRDVNTGAGGIAICRLLIDATPFRTLVPPADLAAGYPRAIALGPDGWVDSRGGMLALSYIPGGTDSLLVWRGEQLLYRHDGDTVWSLAFSPDGTMLATTSRTRGVQLLRASDGALIAERKLPVDDP
jgi:WD40 repeat protein